ncbi:hypothetical protein F5Y04DRAFT_81799 [Hypomontagnella monticulosa]|nr:hypothetical protein F5Y04DRAFT_81799 [Hypomontagnella monticulosa]
MAVSTGVPEKTLAVQATKVYRAVGFAKGYNFWGWFFLVTSLLIFTLTRMTYFNFYNVFCGGTGLAKGDMGAASPGECFYYLQPGRYMVSIKAHLWTILPAALLACGQFTPIFRRKALWLHRINGWISVVLSFIATAFAIPLLPRTMGGGVDVITMNLLLAAMFVVSIYYGVKTAREHKIQQHRAWMMRAWIYGGSIITLRVIMEIASIWMSFVGNFYHVLPCDKVEYMVKGQNLSMNYFREEFPECAPYWLGQDPERHVAVRAYVLEFDPVGIAAAHNMSFGMSGYMAILIHFVGLEAYLYYTDRKQSFFAPKAAKTGENGHAAKVE